MDSILESIKKLLGLSDDYDAFDPDIIIHINSVLSILSQLGVGPKDGYFITDASNTWSEYLGEFSNIELVKSYVYMKVRLIFDPPQNSQVQESFQKNIEEMEWRISVLVDEKTLP